MNYEGTIFLVNGICNHGEDNIDKLGDPLDEMGYHVIDLKVPLSHTWVGWSRRKQKVIAFNLKVQMQPHPKPWRVAAHSFGCLLARRLMEINCYFEAAYLFGAADSDTDCYPADQCKRIHIFYNQHDAMVKLGSLLAWHDFGPLGRVGYNGPDDLRMIKVRCNFMRGFWTRNHNWFVGPMKERWIRYINMDIQGVDTETTDGLHAKPNL